MVKFPKVYSGNVMTYFFITGGGKSVTVPDTVVSSSEFFLETNLPFLPRNRSSEDTTMRQCGLNREFFLVMMTILNTYLMNKFCG